MTLKIPRPTIARRTALLTASTLWVMRTAPTVRPPWTIGTAVASSSVPNVWLGRVS